jgi:hypothetical protein
MFQVDYSPAGSGICIHFDADGFEVTLTNVTFTDGTTIPGPLTVFN